MRRGLALAVLLSLCALPLMSPVSAFAERSIGVSAASFDFTAAQGQAGEGEVWVSNEGDEPITVRVYASDQVVEDDGTVTFVTPTVDANQLQSPASWMTVTLPPDAKSIGNIPYIDMAPGDKARVAFRVGIPQGAVPGDHNIMLFFEMFDPDPTSGDQQARIFGRLGTRVKARVDGEIIEKVEVAPFEIPGYVLGSVVPYSFTVNNKGNVDQRVNVRMVEVDSSGAEVAATEIASDTALYATSSLQKSGAIDDSATRIGRANYKLVVSYPSQASGANGLIKTTEEERAVWIIPAWLPYALGAALLVLVGAAIWASGRRSAQRAAASPDAGAVSDQAHDD